MKSMARRMVALVLALTLAIGMGVPALAASKKTAVRFRGVSAVVTAEGIGLEYTWRKISKADGYEYCYNANYTKKSVQKDYTLGTTQDTSAKIALKDYGTVDFRVRPYREVNGKRVYGAWRSLRKKRATVDSLVVKAIKRKMKKNNLFMKAKVALDVHSGAGKQYKIVSTMNSADEGRATGRFKRDKSGAWWIQVYASKGQNDNTRGWVFGEEVEPVWYE